jgi:hypothetical protein
VFEGKEVAMPIVEDRAQLQRSARDGSKKIVEREEGMISRIDIPVHK